MQWKLFNFQSKYHRCHCSRKRQNMLREQPFEMARLSKISDIAICFLMRISLRTRCDQGFGNDKFIIQVFCPFNSCVSRHTNGRVALLCPADYSYVVAQHGIWMTGSVVVPIGEWIPHCSSKLTLRTLYLYLKSKGVQHPPPEIEYVLQDCDAEVNGPPPLSFFFLLVVTQGHRRAS